MKTRTTTEYRLLIQRTRNAVKEWRTHSLKAVERRVGLLTSPEPWRFYGNDQLASKGPDDYRCCAGTVYDECCCGGVTMREETANTRANLPPIESIRIERRVVTRTAWESAPLKSGEDCASRVISGAEKYPVKA